MPVRRDPPPTDEGWYALHDFRSIDWDAWREAPERERERALDDVIDHLEPRLAVEDADAGDSALYSVLGHKADLLLVHLRPTSADIGALERQFEGTEFAGFTERETSFVSVTEASGYSEDARDYFEGELDESSGLYNYIQSRLKPTIPDATHVCFYPMDKRRQPEQNWYDLPFEERAEHMDAHGDIGREYGGKVVQMITGAIALDDWEWGVTLWGDDLTDMKDLLYEMRFDPSTSQFAEFGSFYVGRRFPPTDLPALLSGDAVPTDGVGADTEDAGPVHPGEAVESGESGRGGHPGDAGASPHGGEDDHAATPEHGEEEEDAEEESTATEASGGATAPDPGTGDVTQTVKEDMTSEMATLGLHRDAAYDAGDYGLVLYSTADAQDVASEVDGLRGNFEHYDSHVTTNVRAEGGRTAVASIWTSERAADTAEGFLTDLPGIVESVRGPLGEGSVADDNEDGDTTPDDGDDPTGIRDELADLDIYAGQPHGEDIYALVLYSQADREQLRDDVASLSEGFDRYETHEGTSVYEDPNSETTAVVSLWASEDAAETAGEHLGDLPEIVGRADEGDGFSTMGMFYTVKPEHREDFVEKFDTVGDMLADMDGHRHTALLVDAEDENDMFIASQWDSKDDAMEFFRSDAFTDTVDWGREILADTPRHVFLA